MPPPGETLNAEVDIKPIEDEVQTACSNAGAKPPSEGIFADEKSPDRKFARATRVITPREEVERHRQASYDHPYALAQSDITKTNVDGEQRQ